VLPVGFRVAIDSHVRARGKTLIGGSPPRVLRLTEAGGQALSELERSPPVSTATRALARRLLDVGMAHPRPSARASVESITVVVPVKDRPTQLERCLGALDPQARVIVVDDGSYDRGACASVAARYGARVVRKTESGGPAAARNAALAQIDTEFVAFIDSDCVAPPCWLQRLLGHFDDPLVAAVAPRVRPLPPGGPGLRVVARYLADRSPFDMGDEEGAVRPGGRVSFLPSAALLVRLAALRDRFDERLRYGEDVDLVWRLHDAGWTVRYDPSVTVTHDETGTLWQMLARRFRYGTAAAPLAVRHPGRLAPVRLQWRPTLVVLLLLRRRPTAAALVATQHGILLTRRASALGLSRASGTRWLAETTVSSGLALAHYAGTVGLPLSVLIALRRRTRAELLVFLTLPALADWRRRHAELDPVCWTALALVDDAAYATGVYWGCCKVATVEPLVPTLR
jgi:mycofactocin system glycosyltransferase